MRRKLGTTNLQAIQKQPTQTVDTATCKKIEAAGGWSWSCKKKELDDKNDGAPAISQLHLQTGSIGVKGSNRSQHKAEQKANLPTEQNIVKSARYRIWDANGN